MVSPANTREARRRPMAGFSLLELLAVIAVVGLLAALAAPATSSLLKGRKLDQAARSVMDALTAGQQQAVTLNRPVEMRLYKFGTPSEFRAIQAFVVEENGTYSPMSRVTSLPDPVVFSPSPTLSPLLDNTQISQQSGSVALPGIGSQYSYSAFQFRPDGSTTLPSAGRNWYATLVDLTQLTGSNDTTPPPNFFTVQVDPMNGRIRIFRR